MSFQILVFVTIKATKNVSQKLNNLSLRKNKQLAQFNWIVDQSIEHKLLLQTINLNKINQGNAIRKLF